jgi:sterol desaturase/sphingolipid hydroxylase (fatty acid hydroxylase superfamily)
MDFIHPAINAVLNALNSLAPFAPLLALCIVAEKLWARYPVSNKTIAINLIYVVAAMALVHGLVLPYLYRLNVFVPQNVWGIQLHATLGLRDIALWAGYLVLYDFLYYWFHRLQHVIPWLWRYHFVHHSEENISASAFARHHWLEEVWRYAFITVPLLVICGNPQVPFAVISVIVTFAILMHWNTPLGFGPLERIFITPRYHRIHHSVEERHINKNFGAFLQLWDWLFKTRYVPQRDEFPATGVRGYSDRHFLHHILPVPILKKK